MAIVVVERTLPAPASFEDLQAMEDAAAWCLELHSVTFKVSYFSRDRTRMICLYEAPDAEAVRKSQETAKLPFDAVWTADAYPGAGSSGS